MKIPFELWNHIFTFLSTVDESNFLLSDSNLTQSDWFHFNTKQCNKEQKDVLWDICFSNKNMMILGEPGTGKTYLLKLANIMLQKLQIITQVCAFTGLAGQQADGATLHRIFPLHHFKGQNQWDKDVACPLNIETWQHSFTPIDGVLFIDEVSMVNPVLFEQIMYFQRAAMNFRFIVLGDFLQLPPISNNDYKRKFFFQTYHMPKMDIFNLTIPQRHADPHFLTMIRYIRKNDYNLSVMKFLQERKIAFDMLPIEDKKTKLYLFHDNKRVDLHNIKFLELVKMPLVEFKYEIKSIQKITKYANTMLSAKELSRYRNNNNQAFEDVPPLRQLLMDQNVKDVSLKIGCHIMFNKNIYDLIHCTTPEECKFYKKCCHVKNEKIDIYNGTRATVVNIYGEGILIRLIINGGLLYFPLTEYSIEISSRFKQNYKIGTYIQYKKNKFAKITMIENDQLTISTTTEKEEKTISIHSRDIKPVPRLKKLVAYVSYYPITLSYAVTIQKAQGMTLDNVVLSLGYIPSPSLVTVAISRCRTSQGVFINGNFQRPQGQIDPLIIEFLKHLELSNKDKITRKLANITDMQSLFSNLQIKIILKNNQFIVNSSISPVSFFTLCKKIAVKYIYDQVLEYINIHQPKLLHLCSMENIVSLLALKKIRVE